jgi:hypothetical protein
LLTIFAPATSNAVSNVFHNALPTFPLYQSLAAWYPSIAKEGTYDTTATGTANGEPTTVVPNPAPIAAPPKLTPAA